MELNQNTREEDKLMKLLPGLTKGPVQLLQRLLPKSWRLWDNLKNYFMSWLVISRNMLKRLPRILMMY